MNNIALIELLNSIEPLKYIKQNPKYHKFNVHQHSIICANQFTDYKMKIVALLHDIGKLTTTDDKLHAYKHEVDSELMAREILTKLKYEHTESVCRLVRYHMLLEHYVNSGISDKGIRRFLRNYGDIYDDLKRLAIADISSDHPHSALELRKLKILTNRIDIIRSEEL